MGYFFVQFVGEFGYGDVLALLGRHLRDFLNGLDNLHEYLKFSYPRLRAPSYFCDHETDGGLHLHYRSKRRGFVNYTMGQLKAVGENFYKIKIEISVIEQEVKFDTVHVSFNLAFENKTTTKVNSAMLREEARLPAVSSAIMYEVFPFIVTFGDDMVIKTIGRGLNQVCIRRCCRTQLEISLDMYVIDSSWEKSKLEETWKNSTQLGFECLGC